MIERRVAWMVSAVALAGCVQEGTVPRIVPDSGPAGSPEARERAMGGVLDRIVKATCDREQSCNTIGPGATFGSRQECENDARGKYAKDLNVANCPGGIDQGGYEDCLTSLDSGQCSGPGDSITRGATCSTKSICVK
jgi:hypothetical protein